MNPLVDPLLLPPRLLLRALDDLHTIAQAMGRLDEVLYRFDHNVDRVVDLGERLEARGAAVIEVGDRVGDRLDRQASMLLEQSRALHEQAVAILSQGERVEHAAIEVARRGAQLAEALPLMQQAVELARPLEGAVERLGRVVDRLPGQRGGARPRP